MMILNTHNYQDWPHLDQTQRIRNIATGQKNLTVRYRACMIATAEYRKNAPKDPSKLLLPVDDDLADARAMLYRPNIIFHVYNDVHDRREHAEIFWKDPERPDQVLPRLMLHFTKNKINGFKDNLILDLDPEDVTLRPKDDDEARAESIEYIEAKENGEMKIIDGRIIITATEYEE